MRYVRIVVDGYFGNIPPGSKVVNSSLPAKILAQNKLMTLAGVANVDKKTAMRTQQESCTFDCDDFMDVYDWGKQVWNLPRTFNFVAFDLGLFSHTPMCYSYRLESVDFPWYTGASIKKQSRKLPSSVCHARVCIQAML